MSLTGQDKIECRQIAREIIKEVLIEHIANCPHHQAYLVTKSKIIGMIIGVVVASGVTSSTLAAIAMKFLG